MNVKLLLVSWLATAAFGGLLLWRELRRPLRRSVESKFQRDARNLAMAGVSGLALLFAEAPVAQTLAALGEKRGWGIVRLVDLPSWLQIALAVILLDYTLYVWHVLTHRVPLLWRFHIVHHADLDMDASTALRFHFGEMLVSVPWRAMRVVMIGASPLALLIWQTATIFSILFHHSNIELPIQFERRLNWLIVTPRMHGIHHSIVREETNSNWSSGLTLWDRLHGTLRLNVPQDEVIIGVPAYREPNDLGLTRLLKLPFVRQPQAWLLPGGELPKRKSAPAPQNQLLA
jgi:sterol desaturase/sphingolipid hydroxylase (fatty acid hydroxylase superfamily)